MRELFISERRYIRNVLWKWTRVRLETSGPVLREEYVPPRTASRIRFNNDYSLQFVTDDDLKEFKSYCAPVLTNTLGVDVFVTVDGATLRPLRTELLGGEGFEIRYFREHIETIEDRLAMLSCPVTLRKTAYCRIFVIENDICFLAFPNDLVPVVRGERRLLCADAESSIACSMDGDEIVYVDGWIRAFVPESERKLEAIAVEEESPDDEIWGRGKGDKSN